MSRPFEVGLPVMLAASCAFSGSVNALTIEWSEDQLGRTPPRATHYFVDLNKDGVADMVGVDINSDGNFEQAYYNIEGDQRWESCMNDTDEDGRWDGGKSDEKPDGTGKGDGKWNGEWMDLNGDGDCDDAGEWAEIPPEDIPVGPVSGGVLVCAQSPDCVPDLPPYTCALVSVPPTPLTTSMGLSRPYPNPHRVATHFQLRLRSTQWVDVAIYDVRGRRIATVVEGMLDAGEHPLSWDGRTVGGDAAPSGVYLLRAHAEDGASVHPLIRLR